MIDLLYLRNVANDGRGPSMTKALHDAADAIERLQRELTEARAIITGLRDMLAEKNELLSLVGAARVRAEAENALLRKHAEAMADEIENERGGRGGDMGYSLNAYRADFPKGEKP